MPEVYAVTPATGVNPTHAIKFGINTSGTTGEESIVVKDAESLNISIDGNIEEWYAMDQDGWVSRLMTAKSIGIQFGGKRNYGDPGNDYVAGLATKIGQECNSVLTVTFPDGAKLVMPCVVNVTSAGGDANGAGGLEWEALSNGKPTYTAA